MRKIKFSITSTLLLLIMVLSLASLNSCGDANGEEKTDFNNDLSDVILLVNEGLESTNIVFTQKNALMYSSFEAAKANDPTKVGPYYNAALKTKKLSDDMCYYISELKVTLIMITCEKSRLEAEKTNLKLLDAKNYIDKPRQYMIGKSLDGSMGKSRELKNRLNNFKSELIAILNSPLIDIHNKPKEIEKLGDIGINTKDNTNVPSDKPYEKYWETSRFAGLPLSAVITMLTLIQNQIKNAEATVVNKLLSSIGASDFKFDTIAPFIIPYSNEIVSGNPYEADIFIAAYSTTDKPKIFVGEGFDLSKGELTGKIDSISVKKGVGKYIITNPSIGTHTYSAVIMVKNPITNEYKTYPIKVGGKYAIGYTVMPSK